MIMNISILSVITKSDNVLPNTIMTTSISYKLNMNSSRNELDPV